MKLAYVFFAIAASLLLFGCFGIGGSPQPTPTPTPTATPLATPTPTQTPRPTATPEASLAATPTPGSLAASVEIMDFEFAPDSLAVTVGTTVTWINMGSAAHTVTSETGEPLNSELLSNGQSWSYTFTEPGTYTYHCRIHRMMTGTITVTP